MSLDNKIITGPEPEPGPVLEKGLITNPFGWKGPDWLKIEIGTKEVIAGTKEKIIVTPQWDTTAPKILAKKEIIV